MKSPERVAELRRRAKHDQRVRRDMLRAPRDRSRALAVAKVDRDNLEWLLARLRTQGMPGVEEIGRYGLHLLWLLIQHADARPDLQDLALRDFERFRAAGDLSADDLAKLTNRVLLSKGQVQRFGTQFDWQAGQFVPHGRLNVVEVDAQRRAWGLMPLASHACLTNARLAPGAALLDGARPVESD